MAQDQLILIITIQKEVPDVNTAKALYQTVKQKVSDQPDIKLHGNLSVRYEVLPD